MLSLYLDVKEGINMNQSVLKAISLLELFIEHKELTLQQISEKADMPKPTAYRLLSTLEAKGLLAKTKDSHHDSRYRLGLKLLEYGNLVAERLEIRELALPYMEKLAHEINEVVHLVIANQYEATYIEKVNSKRALSLHTKIGWSSPLYVGSGPKLLLAYSSREKQEKVLNESTLMTLTNQKVDKEELRKELAEIRKNEYAYSISEQDADTTGISFPIFNYENKVVAALAISGLSSRFKGERLKFIIQKGKESARSISKQLGYSGKLVVNDVEKDA